MADLGIGLGIRRLRLLTDFFAFEDLEPLKWILWTLGDMTLSEFLRFTDLLDRTDLTRSSCWRIERGVSEFEFYFWEPSSVLEILGFRLIRIFL